MKKQYMLSMVWRAEAVTSNQLIAFLSQEKKSELLHKLVSEAEEDRQRLQERIEQRRSDQHREAEMRIERLEKEFALERKALEEQVDSLTEQLSICRRQLSAQERKLETTLESLELEKRERGRAITASEEVAFEAETLQSECAKLRQQVTEEELRNVSLCSERDRLRAHVRTLIGAVCGDRSLPDEDEAVSECLRVASERVHQIEDLQRKVERLEQLPQALESERASLDQDKLAQEIEAAVRNTSSRSPSVRLTTTLSKAEFAAFMMGVRATVQRLKDDMVSVQNQKPIKYQ